ncbi:CDP-archaeol synthase [Aestuariimicrobium soli]|uniref:CDP-archaeol synthase n=1 Tax=Aestuariimicrobium soli TaxID=2035834 RepID=UPI003EBA99E6
MLTALAQIYASLTPAILAAVVNMVWVRNPWLRRLGPIDGGATLPDGRRLFGDNKTWNGLIGVTVLGILAGLLWGWIGHLGPGPANAIGRHNLFLLDHAPTAGWTALTGGLLGLAYGLFELPNSFLKRRLDIRPGHTADTRHSWLFVVLDQIDSVVGCAIVLALLAPVSVALFVGIIVVGGVTHLLLNLVLYAVKLRKHPL